jgi:hypothetical protein
MLLTLVRQTSGVAASGTVTPTDAATDQRATDEPAKPTDAVPTERWLAFVRAWLRQSKATVRASSLDRSLSMG